MAITDNTAKWDVLSVTTPQTNSGNGLLPVGHVYITMGSTAPAGSLPLTGLLYSRNTYADLWNYVNTHPEQLLSESAWQTKYLENNGHVPYYSDGDGSTNFRVPTAVTVDTDENDYIVENYKNGYSWYRKYKSGWVEQGGYFTPSSAYLVVDSTYKIDFIVPMKDTSYVFNNTLNGIYYTGNVGVPAGTLFTIDSLRTTTSVTVNSDAVYVNRMLGLFWEVKGFAAETPSSNRVSWCVKAFGNVEEATGSTNITNVVNNITALNTKVDNFVAGTLNTHATAIAKMQSYFSGNMEETVLYDVSNTDNNTSNWKADITLSDSLYNYDFFKVEIASGPGLSQNQGGGTFILYSVSQFRKMMQRAKNTTSWVFLGDMTNGSWHWNLNPSSSSETFWKCASYGGCYIRAVWGYKLTATGITNKSAVDVSDMSEKIGGLLTTDNHLILPSGLEVW